MPENLYRTLCMTLSVTALSLLTWGCKHFDLGNLEMKSEVLRVERLVDHPIITSQTDPSIGVNIQGPSLIRVPDWIEEPLGKYYLYFADHKGSYIRLAFADEMAGPWRIHKPGALQLEASFFLSAEPDVPEEMAKQALTYMREVLGHKGRSDQQMLDDLIVPHIASPDVHVDDENKRIVMYFHGLNVFASQVSRVAVSADGINFKAQPQVLGRSYMRAMEHDGATFVLAMPGQFYRSSDGLSGFEEGPKLFDKFMRHAALLKRGNTLHVFWTRVGDTPESILHSTIDMTHDWMDWKEKGEGVVLKPERDWEGADAPLEPSQRSTAEGYVNQLRDPAIFEEDGRVFLLYAVAGESGIAIAEVFLEE
jgi:hypothetical protein